MKEKRASVDMFRLLAALFVVMIHTSPLTSFSAEADFWLTRVLARVAVPFFLMVSGFFLVRGNWRGTRTFLKKTALLYAISILLYLPLNLYAGNLGDGVTGMLKNLFFDGTFYHLWYFPAVLLGVLVARALSKLGLRVALPIACLLYLVGLGGDSYYGLVSAFPGMERFYSALFAVSSYTRNGLFMAPLFLLLGAAGRQWKASVSWAGFMISLAAMSGEAFLLHGMGVQRHDSMYLLLPVCMLFLFSLLLSADGGENRMARKVSMLVYILHPWCIVLVRGAAKVAGLEALFVENSLVHFLAVAALSFGAAAVLYALRPMKPQPRGRAWREIDIPALRHNARALQARLAPDCRLMAVVKADAYGHGAKPVARALQKAGMRAFAVASAAEGIELRKCGIRGTILILGYTPPGDVPLLVRWRLTQAAVDLEHAQALSRQGRRLHVHLAVDTGMHRLGIPAEEPSALEEAFALPNLHIDGMFSHLCVSDSLEPACVDATVDQLERFYHAAEALQADGYDVGKLHIQASYGILNLPPQHCAYARAGIALYGVRSDNAPVQSMPDLRPVLSLRARVASVRELAAGDAAGYGLAFSAERPTVLAAATVGYADGLPRSLGERGVQVLVRGQWAPVVGRLCMDQMLLDVTDIPGVRPGDVVTIIGRDGANAVRAEDLAEQCGTITNELLSRLGKRPGLVILDS